MCEEFKNEKKKEQIFLTFRSGDLNPRFSVIFRPMIWIFMKSEEDEIKSKQASRKVRTLPKKWGKKWGKKCSTGQRCIRKKVTSYKIHILVLKTCFEITCQSVKGSKYWKQVISDIGAQSWERVVLMVKLGILSTQGKPITFALARKKNHDHAFN